MKTVWQEEDSLLHISLLLSMWYSHDGYLTIIRIYNYIMCQHTTVEQQSEKISHRYYSTGYDSSVQHPLDAQPAIYCRIRELGLVKIYSPLENMLETGHVNVILLISFVLR